MYIYSKDAYICAQAETLAKTTTCSLCPFAGKQILQCTSVGQFFRWGFDAACHKYKGLYASVRTFFAGGAVTDNPRRAYTLARKANPVCMSGIYYRRNTHTPTRVRVTRGTLNNSNPQHSRYRHACTSDKADT